MLQEKIQAAALEAQKKAQEQMRDEQIKIMTDVYSAVFERAIAYVNVIILAGYAGAFTLLGATKDFLSSKTLISSALMLGFSIATFCGWEITKMILNGKYHLKFAELIQRPMEPQQFFTRQQQLIAQANTAQIRINKWWGPILVLSIMPGFSAGGLLLWNYIVFLAK